MPTMSRSTALVFVVLGAALAGFAFSSASGRFDEKKSDPGPSIAASPQTAELDWREKYGKPGEQLVFGVEQLQVLENGWRASLVLTNRTSTSYEVGDPGATLDRAFGLMLFRTGETRELERRNRNGMLPATRPAVRYEPSLPRSSSQAPPGRGRSLRQARSSRGAGCGSSSGPSWPSARRKTASTTESSGSLTTRTS